MANNKRGKSLSNIRERTGDRDNLKVAWKTYVWEQKALASKNLWEKNCLQEEWDK